MNIFRILNCLVMKHGKRIDIVIDNIFRKYFTWFGGLGP